MFFKKKVKQTINVNHVIHPPHYNLPGRKECITEIEEYYGNEVARIFCLTSAYRYLYRAGHKYANERLQDIAKAEWYIDRAISYGPYKKDTLLQENVINLYEYTKSKLKELLDNEVDGESL